MTSKTQTIGTVSLTTDYFYDPSGRLASMTLPSGKVISYGYDNHLPTSVTVDSTPILTAATYEPFGPVNGWTWGDSSVLVRGFDARGVMNSYTVMGEERVLDFDDAGRISFVDDASSLLVPDNETYTYTITPASNQLASIAGPTERTYSYDAAGNTIGDGVHTYGYDDRGRLTSVDSAAVSYAHNGQGQRVKKDVQAAVTLFAYDQAGHIVGEYDASGAPLQEHVWFNDEPVAVVDDTGAYYVHTDHLGTPRAVSDGSTAIWRWESDPFGSDAAEEDPDEDLTGFTYNLRFPGQYYDPETDLHYNYYRTYDPATGRYLESDPIGLNAGLNTFAYVGNMPTMRMDPLGLDWIEYTGEQVTYYGGNPGDRSKALRSCNATSGKIDFQNKKFQSLSDKGPVPEGKYRINLAPSASRWANQVAISQDADGNRYYALVPPPNGGIERIPFNYLNDWGTWRAKLDRIDGKPRHGRYSFYLHDSNKGETSGCVESCNDLKGDLLNLRQSGVESVEFWINYTDATTNGGRW